MTPTRQPAEPGATDIRPEIWMLISELWRMLRYQSPGAHKNKLKAARHLQEFVDSEIAAADEYNAEWQMNSGPR